MAEGNLILFRISRKKKKTPLFSGHHKLSEEQLDTYFSAEVDIPKADNVNVSETFFGRFFS